MNNDEAMKLIEDKQFFDDMESESVEKYSLKMLEVTIQNRPDLIEQFIESYEERCDILNESCEEFTYGSNMRAERYEEWADTVYSKDKILAKLFYLIAGEKYEYYWDLIWLKSKIVENYLEYDSDFIVKCAELEGHEPEGDDEDIEEEDFEDFAINLNISDHSNIGELHSAVCEYMANLKGPSPKTPQL